MFGEDRRGVCASFECKGVKFFWRWIPPGRFLMGSPDEEKGRTNNEGPQHEVILSQGFWMGETPVTQEQWEAVMGDNPSEFKGERRPVETVSWKDSQRFCERMNDLVPGLRAQLPTEAQWEYACRAGSEGAYCDGSDCTEPVGKDPALEVLGWYGENSGNSSRAVKGKAGNAWGLFDVHGNVWEWCRDAREDYVEGKQVDPFREGVDSAFRVLRGGSWLDDAGYCRSAIRLGPHPENRYRNVGLRLSAGQELESAEPSAAEQPQ